MLAGILVSSLGAQSVFYTPKKSALRHETKARKALRARDFDRAVSCLRKALKADARHAGARLLLIDTYRVLAKEELLLDEIEQLLGIWPKKLVLRTFT